MLPPEKGEPLLLETGKEGSAITTFLTGDLRCVRREEEEKERTEMLSQENVDLRRRALDHKRVRREEENKLEAANNEIGVLKGRLDEMAREAAREREALDKAWQRKLDEAEVLARIAIKEARRSGTTGVAAGIAFGGHVKTSLRPVLSPRSIALIVVALGVVLSSLLVLSADTDFLYPLSSSFPSRPPRPTQPSIKFDKR
ncbi:hypothetical protein EHS25_004823 [Saitozyma podzolica]|uniref:Uncharacterized protein n=1 Tax=Saitozyma podzolica TaxID=1890683 RepID=A0A427Y2X2_9TREE|nr:hypothetical protein EHS25_004823 [Saitozyma podzolica]